MNRIAPLLVCAALAGCGGGDPVDAAGSYTIAVTNRDNGCEFASWTVGDTATGIPVTITQDGEEATATIEGATGFYVGVLLGSNEFVGEVNGDNLDLTLFGTTSATQGSCSYTVNAVLDAELSNDVLEGQILYETSTNGSPDCAEKEGCASQQDFNGTRPPS